MPRLHGGGGSSTSKSPQTNRNSKCLKRVAVTLLNDEELQISVEGKAKVQDLFDGVCNALGVKETQYFGLAILKDGEYEFLDPKNKLSKHAPKGWKSDSSNGLNKLGKPLLNVYFKVQLYVEHVSLLKEDLTRHHYYLQLKRNVLSAPVLCREEACFVMASYALQADIGNFSEENHTGHYFSPSSYFPPWVIKRRGEDYFIKHVPAMHGDQKGTSRVYAQKAFIREASTTAPEHAMHFYRLKKTKTEQSPSILLGICTKGIQLYEDSGEGKYPLCEYSWGIIKRLVFQKKKFELQVEGAEGRKITYYTSSEAKSKHLLRLCKMTHAFQMQTQSLVDRAKKRESAADKKKYRESYISGDISWSDLDSSMTTTSFSEVSNMMELQRRSVVSNVSSVTTSGIVSDERSPLEKNFSEVELDPDDNQVSGYTLESTLTPNTRLPLSILQLESSYSRQSSGKDEKNKNQWLPGANMGIVSANNRHSVAMSEASSGSRWGNPAIVCSDSEWASDDEAYGDDEEEDTERRQKTVKTKHGSMDDTSSTDSVQKMDTSSSPSGGIKTLPLIDPQRIQAEIASKDVCTPLLNALCNDRSLLMMQQQQYNDNTTQVNCNSNEEDNRCHSLGGDEDQGTSQTDLNISLTTLVSHSSFDSDIHGSIYERLNASSSLSGHLSKHQTLSMLNDLPDSESPNRLPYNGSAHFNSGSDGRLKCQTLPSKINASEQMLLMGRAASPAPIKEEYVSYSAPNLSPDTDIKVAIPGC